MTCADWEERKMKVILKEDVKKIGKKGEMLEVADGYGRNFLIARGLAEEATAGKVRELAEKNKTAKIKDDRARTAAEEAKKKFSGKIVVLKAKAGEGGKLFGSVTSGNVAEAILAQYGVTVDKKDVKAEEAVKMLGDYKAKAKLYSGIEAEFTLRVEGE